jgi:hypothetical protein
MIDSEYLIDHLGLKKHPEGGWFREVYRSEEILPEDALPERYAGGRHISTSIYFLLEGNDFSAFHRLGSDETWHFYSGCPLRLLLIHPDGTSASILLGQEPDKGMLWQYTIPHGTWFAARPLDLNSYSLIGCTVSPGFDFSDFELAVRDKLISAYPTHSSLIEQFT